MSTGSNTRAALSGAELMRAIAASGVMECEPSLILRWEHTGGEIVNERRATPSRPLRPASD